MNSHYTPCSSLYQNLAGLAVLLGSALWACAAPIQVMVGALALPSDSDGLLQLRTSESESKPLQLSTRYFSEPMSIDVPSFELYATPLGKTPPLATPLLKLPIPQNATSCIIVIWNAASADKPSALAGRVFPTSDWAAGSMLLMNAATTPIGIQAGTTKQMLKPGAKLSFPGKNPEEDMPVKMFIEDPKAPGKAKIIFSSVWKIASTRRELCVIHSGARPDSVEVRSLLERVVVKEP